MKSISTTASPPLKPIAKQHYSSQEKQLQATNPEDFDFDLEQIIDNLLNDNTEVAYKPQARPTKHAQQVMAEGST